MNRLVLLYPLRIEVHVPLASEEHRTFDDDRAIACRKLGTKIIFGLSIRLLAMALCAKVPDRVCASVYYM